MVFKQGLERFEDLDFTGDSRGRLSLPLDHSHTKRPLVSGHQALQMLQEQLKSNTEEGIAKGINPPDSSVIESDAGKNVGVM